MRLPPASSQSQGPPGPLPQLHPGRQPQTPRPEWPGLAPVDLEALQGGAGGPGWGADSGVLTNTLRTPSAHTTAVRPCRALPGSRLRPETAEPGPGPMPGSHLMTTGFPTHKAHPGATFLIPNSPLSPTRLGTVSGTPDAQGINTQRSCWLPWELRSGSSAACLPDMSARFCWAERGPGMARVPTSCSSHSPGRSPPSGLTPQPPSALQAPHRLPRHPDPTLLSSWAWGGGPTAPLRVTGNQTLWHPTDSPGRAAPAQPCGSSGHHLCPAAEPTPLVLGCLSSQIPEPFFPSTHLKSHHPIWCGVLKFQDQDLLTICAHRPQGQRWPRSPGDAPAANGLGRAGLCWGHRPSSSKRRKDAQRWGRAGRTLSARKSGALHRLRATRPQLQRAVLPWSPQTKGLSTDLAQEPCWGSQSRNP